MNQEGYPVFKGLQKPLEFMGIRRRLYQSHPGSEFLPDSGVKLDESDCSRYSFSRSF